MKYLRRYGAACVPLSESITHSLTLVFQHTEVGSPTAHSVDNSVLNSFMN